MQNIHILLTANTLVFFLQNVPNSMSVRQFTEWLTSNFQPLSQVASYMEDTAGYRAKWIRANNLTISEILEHLAHLMTKGMVRGKFVLKN